MTNPANGYCLIFEYPGRDTCLSQLYPRLAANSWPATTSINCLQVHNSGTGYLTEAQILQLAAAGWDVAVNSYDARDFGSECYGWTYDEVVALLTAAHDYLASLGIPGADVLAPKEGLYDQSWYASLAIFHWIVWENNLLTRWPQASRWLPITWTPTSDSVDWPTILKPILDTLTGNPDQLVCLQVTSIVAANPQGPDTSTARLDQIVAYLLAIGANLTTVSRLAADASHNPTSGLALTGAGD